VVPTGTVLKAYLRISGALRSTVLKVMQELQCVSRYCTWGKHSFAFAFARSQHFPIHYILALKTIDPALVDAFLPSFFHCCLYLFIQLSILQSTTFSSSLDRICLFIHTFSNPSKYPLILTLIRPCPSVRSILHKLTHTSFHLSAVKKCDKKKLYLSTILWLMFTSTLSGYYFVQR
jgi:hypothetical protein